MTRLLVTISAHGFGHLSQTAPVLNALRRQCPDLHLTVASRLPEARLRARIAGEFRIEARALDFGFEMEDAFRIARESSARAYLDFHADWDARVASTADWLDGLQPDLLLANAAYLPLAAAARLGLSAYGMSSLNWADLVAHVFAGEAWMPPIHAQMLQAYRSARAFIKLRPGMDMPDLANGRWVAPVASLGRERRTELRERCAVQAGDKLVLVAFGGIDTRLPMAHWPLPDGLRWLVPQAWGIDHPRVTAIEAVGWHFSDLIASVDALIGKPGYGTFVETACNGIPMLYAARPGWPEQDALIPWLHQHARAREVSATLLQRGELASELDALWRLPAPRPPQASGADEVAALLVRGADAG